MGQSTAIFGPMSIIGQNPTLGPSATPYVGGPAAVSDSNPDLAPSLIWGGFGVRDPRWLPRIGAGALAAGGYPNQDVGFYLTGDGLLVCDAIPSTLQTNNIAAAALAVNGVAMALAAASTGITVLATPLSLFVPLGATIPAGALVLDGNPGYVGGGTSGGFQFFDPTKGIARAVSITASATSAGGNFLVRGYDIFGQAMSERITAVTNSTVNGKKAFKFVASVTPQFSEGTAGHTYSVGTSDVYGLNVRADRFTYVEWTWDVTEVTTSTGFVAADATNPATSTTGDVRGTIATPTASNGVRRLYAAVGLTVANAVGASFAAVQAGIVGQTQA